MSAESPVEGSRTTTPFHDLADFVAIPRVAALQLAPDGSWLAAAVQTLSSDGKKYLTSLWRIDTQGGPPRRLTRSAEGEANPRFLPDGSLLFTSKRPDPGADPASKDRGDVTALWLLPSGGGEARVIATAPGGVAAAEAARDARVVVLASSLLRGGRTRRRRGREQCRGRRQVAEGARRRRGDRHLARVGADQVLGSRPRPGPGAVVRRRPRPDPGGSRASGGVHRAA